MSDERAQRCHASLNLRESRGWSEGVGLKQKTTGMVVYSSRESRGDRRREGKERAGVQMRAARGEDGEGGKKLIIINDNNNKKGGWNEDAGIAMDGGSRHRMAVEGTTGVEGVQ